MKRLPFIYSLYIFLSILFFVSSGCTKDNRPLDVPSEGENGDEEPILAPLGGQGVLILNEGNMSDGTGYLDVIAPDGEYHSRVYQAANGSARLGNVSQDLFISGDRLYIISQNGEKNGGEGLLIVADAKEFTRQRVYKQSDLPGLDWPTHVAVLGEDIYIRDKQGISYLAGGEGAPVRIAETDWAVAHPMYVVDGCVVALRQTRREGVLQGDELLFLKNGRVERSLVSDGTPRANWVGMALDREGNLWLADAAQGSLECVNSQGLIVKEKEQRMGVAFSSRKGNAAPLWMTGDTLYFCNGTTTLYRHILGQGEAKALLYFNELDPLAAVYYNSLAVDPSNGLIYFSSFKDYGIDYKKNVTLVVDPREIKVIRRYENKNAFPAGVFPRARFK